MATLALPALAMAPESGLKVGESVTPFHPQHIAGPDKGTDTCPPCKYGNRPAVQVWVNGDANENVAAIANTLSARVANSKAELKGFVINLTRCDACVKATDTIAEMVKSKNIGIAHLSSQDEAVTNYKVSTEADVKNTVFVYKNRKVAAKFVNLKADAAGLKALNAAIDGIEK
ncbi:hypothetical protein QPK87_20100 [Kamptonema cortianum]|nr:hypothetical protein [Kamptonema cortianum]